MTVSFTVLGEPKGKQRPRVANGHAYTPRETVQYENLVCLEYRRQCHDFMFEQGVPLSVTIEAFFSIPKSASKKRQKAMEEGEIRPTKKSDVDNIIKACMDGVNKVAFYDDAQVVDCQLKKFYSYNPRVVIAIQDIACEDSAGKEK